MKKFKRMCATIISAMMALSISVAANAAEFDSGNVPVFEM